MRAYRIREKEVNLEVPSFLSGRPTKSRFKDVSVTAT
jgi:hypothetical protein